MGDGSLASANPLSSAFQLFRRLVQSTSRTTELHDRRDYVQGHLSEDTVDADPIAQFNNWLDDARACETIDEPLAMTVATANSLGIPSARIVLLRSAGEDGFVFYTNRNSHKGRDLTQNPHAALVFYWGPLERQVRIEGAVSLVSDEDSDEYFASRPHRSQIAAVASDQSRVLDTRATLDDRFARLENQYPAGSPIARPQHWGGYRVTPDMIEFWQGGRNRLHDRLQYTRAGDGWQLERLYP